MNYDYIRKAAERIRLHSENLFPEVSERLRNYRLAEEERAKVINTLELARKRYRL